MYKILEKTQFSEKVFKFRIEAPAIAKHAHAGQFLMVRANETGERVPFTLAGWNGDEGWVEFIFMVIGKTTEMLSTYEAGESLRDVVGPLGVPTEMAEGPCAVIGGGVGLAIAFPVAKHLVETGHEVHAIMGARTKDLLLMEDQFRELLDEDHIHITTDDGSYGEKGVVTAPLEKKIVEGANFDELPARKEEVEHAEEEGIIFKTLCNPVEIHANDEGFVKSITCIEMELGEPDASGRRRPIEKKGSEFELEVDTVIMSLGTSPNPLIRSTTPGLETNKHGCIVTEGDEGKTSREGVYAGGDAVTGAATVIKAMGAGKAAAKAIDEYIQNQ